MRTRELACGLLTLALLGGAGMWGCETASVLDCGEGEHVAASGADYCAFTAEQAPRADCPSALPTRTLVRGAVICSAAPVSPEELPDAVCEAAGTTCPRDSGMRDAAVDDASVDGAAEPSDMGDGRDALLEMDADVTADAEIDAGDLGLDADPGAADTATDDASRDDAGATSDAAGDASDAAPTPDAGPEPPVCASAVRVTVGPDVGGAMSAMLTGTLSSGASSLSGRCASTSTLGENVFRVSVPEGSWDLVASTATEASVYDMVAYLQRGCGPAAEELSCLVGSGTSPPIVSARSAAPGEHTIVVEPAFSFAAGGPFGLAVLLRPVGDPGDACNTTCAFGASSCGASTIASRCAEGACVAGTCVAATAGCAGVQPLALGGTPASAPISGSLEPGMGIMYGSCGLTMGTEAAYAVTVPAGSFDLVVNTSSGRVVYVRRGCAETGADIGCAVLDTFGPRQLEIEDIAAGSYTVVIERQGGVSTSTSTYQGSVTLRPVVAVGSTCDAAGAANRCASGSACVRGRCLDAAMMCAMAIPVTPTGTPPVATVTGAFDASSDSVLSNSCATSNDPEALYTLMVPDGTWDILATTRIASTPMFHATRLSVRATCIDAASELGCSAPSGGADSRAALTVRGVAGGVYTTVVDGQRGVAFGLQTTLRAVVATGGACDPMNVSSRCAAGACVEGTCVDPTAGCAGARTLTLSGSPMTTTVRGTLEPGSGAMFGSCGSTPGTEAVYSIDVPTDPAPCTAPPGTTCGFALLATAMAPSSSSNTVLYVRRPCAAAGADEACDDDTDFTTARVLLPRPASGTHTIVVERQGGATTTTSYTLTATLLPLLTPGSTCDPTGLVNRCAAGTCTSGVCP